MKKTIRININDLEQHLGIQLQDDVLQIELSRDHAAMLAVELIEKLAGDHSCGESTLTDLRQGRGYRINRVRLY
jgi:hypothetical protein